MRDLCTIYQLEAVKEVGMKNIYLFQDLQDLLEDIFENKMHQNYFKSMIFNQIITSYQECIHDEILGETFQQLYLNSPQVKYLNLLIGKFAAHPDEVADFEERIQNFQFSAAEYSIIDRALFESNSLFKQAILALKQIAVTDDLNDWRNLLRHITPIFSLEMAIEVKALLTRMGLIVKNKQGLYKPAEGAILHFV